MEIIKPIPTIIIGLFLSIEFSFSSETKITPGESINPKSKIFQSKKRYKVHITQVIDQNMALCREKCNRIGEDCPWGLLSKGAIFVLNLRPLGSVADFEI